MKTLASVLSVFATVLLLSACGGGGGGGSSVVDNPIPPPPPPRMWMVIVGGESVAVPVSEDRAVLENPPAPDFVLVRRVALGNGAEMAVWRSAGVYRVAIYAPATVSEPPEELATAFCDSNLNQEINPFDKSRCRPLFSCVGDRTEVADGVCELQCGNGEEANPFDADDCRTAFACSGGKQETADRVCECPAGLSFDRDGVCEAVVVCASPLERDGGTNRCECNDPNLEVDGECQVPVVCVGGKVRDDGTNTCGCPAGLSFDRDGVCEAVVVCASPLDYNGGTNECECNDPNLEVDGECQVPVVCAGGKVRDDGTNTCGCPAGLSFDRDGVCEAVVVCASPLERDGGTNRCECNDPNLEVGGGCQVPVVCVGGKVRDDGTNTCGCPAGLSFDRDGVCEAVVVCASPLERDGGTNRCECNDPNLEVDGECQVPVVCAGGKVRDDATNTCGCPAESPFDRGGVCEAVVVCASPLDYNGGTNECECNDPNLEVDGGCQVPVVCAGGKVRDDGTNTCGCPAGLSFDRDGVCEAVVVCASLLDYNGGTNECECNDPNLEVDGECQVPVVCAGGKVRDDGTNTCGCPAGLSFDRDGVCEAVVVCAGGKVRDDEANTCGCPAESPFDRDGVCEAVAACNGGTVNEENVCECAEGERYFPDLPDGAGCAAPVACVGGTVNDANACECGTGEELFRGGTSCEIRTACGGGTVSDENACECASGTEEVNGECLSVCRRFWPWVYDEATGACKCLDDYCRELDRGFAAFDIDLPAAHAITLADGTRLLGQGVNIGIIESGPLHWGTLSATTHSQLPDIEIFGYNPTVFDDDYDGTPEEAAHGIAVAGILAAKRDGEGLVGVAPEASYEYGLSRHLVPFALLSDADIFNMSWGTRYLATRDFRATIDGEFNLEATRKNLRDFIFHYGYKFGDFGLDDLLTSGDPVDKKIFVWSAGNDNGKVVEEDHPKDFSEFGGPVFEVGQTISADSPSTFAGMGLYYSDMTINSLAVAAIDQGVGPRVTLDGEVVAQGHVAHYSNRCGEGSAAFCLAAPGRAFFRATREELRNGIEAHECPLEYDAEDFADYDDLKDKLALHANTLLCLEKNPGFFSEIAEKNLRDGVGFGAEFILAPETEDFQQRYNDDFFMWTLPADLPVGYNTGQGTSYAAPLVSGSLALMKQYFMGATDCGAGADCGLGNHELVERILATANNRGIYADESVYGAGRLDLENALTPQGELMLLTGESLGESRAHSLSQSGWSPGAAFGDAPTRALRGNVLAAFDEMNAPFPISSGAMLTEAVDDGRELGEVLRARQAGEVAPALAGLEWDDGAAWFSLNAPGDANFGTGFGFRRKGSNFFSGESRNPYAALAGNGIVAGGALRLNNNGTFRAAMFGENIRDETRTRGALVEWSVMPVGGCTPDRNLSPPQSFSRKVGHREGSLTGLDRSGRRFNPRPAQWSFQLGAVEELDGMLRSSGSGVFGALRARTTFAGIHWRSPRMFNNWHMRIAAHAGRTSSGSGTWLSATERLWSGSYALGLERGNVLSVGDSLGFRLRQPLRAEGGFRMRVPTGRTKYGELTWREVSGEPSGRELELEARYGRRTGDGSWWMSAGVVEDAGHDASAKTEGRGMFGFERAF